MQTTCSFIQILSRTKCKDIFEGDKGNWSMDMTAGIKKLLLNFIGHDNIKALK